MIDESFQVLVEGSLRNKVKLLGGSLSETFILAQHTGLDLEHNLSS